MHRAHRRDAVHTQKFFFRKNLYSPAPGHACDPIPHLPTHHLNGLPSYIPTRTQSASGATSACSSHAGSRSHSPTTSSPPRPVIFGPVEDEYAEYTINEIMNGDGGDFPGLMGVVGKYLDGMDMKETTRAELEKSLDLIRRRASGPSLPSSLSLSLIRTDQKV
jgi:glutamate--cysteine ligase catalytic subunit